MVRTGEPGSPLNAAPTRRPPRLLAFALRLAWRDLRSGHLTVLLLGLVVAVAALTAVGLFTDRVARGVERQAASVLAADLSVRSAQPPRDTLVGLAQALGAATVRTVSFPTMVSPSRVPDDGGGETSTQRAAKAPPAAAPPPAPRLQLVSLKAAEAGYPLRGEVLVADAIGAPARVAEGLPAPGTVWADANLLLKLGGETGMRLAIGAETFTVSRVLVSRPDQAFAFAEVAPAVLMRLSDLDGTGLLGPGSRVVWRQLFAGEANTIAALEPALDAALAPGETLTDPASLQGPIRDSLDNLQRFLGLAAMSGVILAAAAVAIAAARFMRRHLDTAALMKVLGRRQRDISVVFCVEVLIVALSGAALGIVAGYVVQWGLTGIAGRLIDVELPSARQWPLASGAVTGLLVTAGFALPQLLALRRTPALRVLRADLPSPGPAQLTAYASALLALALLLWLVVRDAVLVGWLLAGLAGGMLLLLGLAYAAIRLITLRRSGVGVSWRYGLANVARRGWDSAAQVVAFGLGLCVMLLLGLLRGDLLDEWQRSLPPDAPNYFFLNVQPHERAAVRRLFADGGVEAAPFAPLSRGRLLAINGTPLEEIDFPRDGGGVVAQREANISWARALPAANRIVAGRWWSSPHVAEISIEEETFRSLGLALGDRLTFAVAGESFTVPVTSVREVDWDSFEPNFFLVFSPGALGGDFPTSYLTSAHIDDAQREVLVTLGKRFPAVTVFDVNALLSQVRMTIERAVAAIQYVFGLALVAAVLVLLAAVEATRDTRLLEAATLRAIGASRGQILAGIAAEYGIIGGLAGLGAAAGAGAIAWALGRNAFDFDYVPGLGLLPAGLITGLVLVGAAGLAATARSARVPAASILSRQ